MAKAKSTKKKEKHPGGRPTKYKKEYAQKLIEFFSIPPSKEIEIPHYKNGEVSWVDKRTVANDYPKLYRFAESIGVHRDTVHEWAHAKDENGDPKYPEFSDAFKYAKQLLKDFLIANGLAGNYHPTAFVFVAKNITDMRDVKGTEVTGKDGGPIRFANMTDEELRELLARTT